MHSKYNSSPVVDYTGLTERYLLKMAQRKRIGWVDWSSDSYDRFVASAKVERLFWRQCGLRLTLAQAMYPERYPAIIKQMAALSTKSAA